MSMVLLRSVLDYNLVLYTYMEKPFPVLVTLTTNHPWTGVTYDKSVFLQYWSERRCADGV
jgi:hypothetical protein